MQRPFLSAFVAWWTACITDSAHFEAMARQLTLWAAALLLIGVVAAALAPPAEQPAAPVFPAPTSRGAPRSETVEADLPSRTPVVAAVGDVVRLHISSAQPDRATVAGLGVSAPVGPGSEGLVELVTDQPGRWAVRLEPAGTPIGVLEVSE
jgi:hypothetical protein